MSFESIANECKTISNEFGFEGENFQWQLANYGQTLAVAVRRQDSKRRGFVVHGAIVDWIMSGNDDGGFDPILKGFVEFDADKFRRSIKAFAEGA